MKNNQARIQSKYLVEKNDYLLCAFSRRSCNWQLTIRNHMTGLNMVYIDEPKFLMDDH